MARFAQPTNHVSAAEMWPSRPEKSVAVGAKLDHNIQKIRDVVGRDLEQARASNICSQVHEFVTDVFSK